MASGFFSRPSAHSKRTKRPRLGRKRLTWVGTDTDVVPSLRRWTFSAEVAPARSRFVASPSKSRQSWKSLDLRAGKVEVWGGLKRGGKVRLGLPNMQKSRGGKRHLALPQSWLPRGSSRTCPWSRVSATRACEGVTGSGLLD